RSVTALGTVAVALAGCGGTVNLSANFPAPMTKRLPLTAQVQYPESLREFSHIEEALDTTRWTIALGRPSMRMLDSVLGSCLTLVPAGGAGSSPDLVIEPEIIRFELGVPGRSKVDIPAAWVEFDIRITGADGAPLTRLKIPGYGEGSHGGGGLGRNLSEAAEYALRDAGATLTQELGQDAAILALIGSRS
ncbi:MAG: hypothetical protein OXM59_09675, partial [Gammaproteobacteria bacterium]|nr:hypothetical protein [Gammaproteobacteria bacterium]